MNTSRVPRVHMTTWEDYSCTIVCHSIGESTKVSVTEAFCPTGAYISLTHVFTQAFFFLDLLVTSTKSCIVQSRS